jgi:hypothetical protein
MRQCIVDIASRTRSRTKEFMPREWRTSRPKRNWPTAGFQSRERLVASTCSASVDVQVESAQTAATTAEQAFAQHEEGIFLLGISREADAPQALACRA